MLPPLLSEKRGILERNGLKRETSQYIDEHNRGNYENDMKWKIKPK